MILRGLSGRVLNSRQRGHTFILGFRVVYGMVFFFPARSISERIGVGIILLVNIIIINHIHKIIIVFPLATVSSVLDFKVVFDILIGLPLLLLVGAWLHEGVSVSESSLLCKGSFICIFLGFGLVLAPFPLSFLALVETL